MHEQPPIRSTTVFAIALVCGAGAFLYTLYARSPRRPSYDATAAAAMSSRRAIGAMAIDGPYPRDRYGLEKAAAESPDNILIFFDLARIAESQGDTAAAIKYYTAVTSLAAEAVKANPNDLRSTFAASWALDRLGKKADAEPGFLLVAETYASRLEQGRARDPRFAYQRIGWSRAKLGDSTAALAAWKQALKILQDRTPDSLATEEQYDLGCLLALTGNKDGALAALDTALAKGFAEPEWARADEDLESLRSDPRFKDLLMRMEEGHSRRRAGE